MDVHKRFMRHRTIEVWLILNLTSNNNTTISQLVQGFNEDVQHINKLLYPLKFLETVRTVLCSFYKQKLYSDDDKCASKKLMYQLNAKPFEKMNVDEIQKALYRQKLDPEALSLVLDILILQMVLYHDVHSIVDRLENLQSSIYRHLQEYNDINILDIKLMNCYLDTLFLHQKSSRLTTRIPYLGTVCQSFRRNVSSCQPLLLKDHKKCQLFTLILPKLMEIWNDDENSTLIWDSIFVSGGDSANILSILCMTADIWFPIESGYDKRSIDRTMEESVWLLLLRGLSSSIPLLRKQALYLIKRIVDYTDKHKSQGLELGSYERIRPLICTGDYPLQITFKKNLNNYILTLEALEEKQKHLITPVLPLWKTSVNETFEQKNSQSSLHVAWIRCAFARILQHNDNTIVKWGLLNVLTLDPELYDDDFLSIVLSVLNNTYLYENDGNEAESIVSKELARFLDYTETRDTDVVTRFVIKASKIEWSPVALYYVIHALSMVKRMTSIWREVELEAIKSLAENNLTMHCRVLRIGSQIELLETVTHFATESLDLAAVANILSAFSTREALIRGQLAWKRTSTWLSKIVRKEEALSFIQEICKQLMSEDSYKDLSMKSFSLIIMLFHDGHLIFDSKFCPGLASLRNLLNCLIGVDSRPYVSAELRNTSIRLIYQLLDLTSSKDCILRELISDYVDASLRFIFKTLRKVSDETLFDNISTYVLITQHFLMAEGSIISKREALNHIERFEIESWNIIDDGEDSNNVQRFFGIKMLYSCIKAMSTKLRNYKFIGPLCKTYKIPMNQLSEDAKEANQSGNENMNLKKIIAAEYYTSVAKLFFEYLKEESVNDWIPDINWIEQVAYLIQVGSNDIFVPVAGILSQIFYKEAVKATDINDFKAAIRLCWNSTLESNECWLAKEELIDLIFSSPFLECKETKELTIEFTQEIVEKGDKIPGLGIILLKGLKQVKEEYLFNFHGAILACLLHGTVPSLDKKIKLQACSYVLDCYQDVYPNYLSNINVNINVATRAHAITLLHKMITDNPVHASKLLQLIAARLDKNHDELYLRDPQIHRHGIRMMQVLLVLQPVLQNDDIETLYLLMCNEILSDNSQPDIRLMQEWLLVRIYLEGDDVRAKIWDLLDKAQKKSASSMCSVISILYHVTRSLSSDLQLDFMNLAFQYIMPCCMAQQLNVRSCAQVIASKLYDLAKEESYSTVTEKYRDFYNAVTKCLKYEDQKENSVRLQDDFYFNIFNAIEDYSLQTIFYELPRLLNVPSDEYIPPQMFEKFGYKESNSHPLKLLNIKSDVSEAQSYTGSLKSSENAGQVTDDIDSSVYFSNDIQKKCIPWTSMTPIESELSEISKTLESREKVSTKGNKIILVASLVDELPNLGGLSRTCEILGVEEFVVASIKQTENEEFKSLSVLVEKLINVVEVKPQQLQQYLIEKRSMGYSLVGAEETVNSTNLMDIKFEKKTLLLLGNEKAGIPANLISLLDKCVEIPQAGEVGSLNVHVTGALCLWEYFKQHNSS